MGREVDVPMEIPPGVDDVTAAVYDPDGKLESSTFQREPSDGLYHLRFIPKKAGQHKVRGVWDPVKRSTLNRCAGLPAEVLFENKTNTRCNQLCSSLWTTRSLFFF